MDRHSFFVSKPEIKKRGQEKSLHLGVQALFSVGWDEICVMETSQNEYENFRFIVLHRTETAEKQGGEGVRIETIL